MALDDPTAGDGACFYRAVVQQARRPEIEVNLRYRVSDHKQLRQAVVDLVHEYYKIKEPFIMEFAQLYEAVLAAEKNLSFEQYIAAQYKTSEFADHVFIQVTSQLLGVPIWITSNTSTPQHPYTKILPEEGRSHQHCRYPIVLGLINGAHFQSLLPVTAAAPFVGDEELKRPDD